jgi:hypothetical protein
MSTGFDLSKVKKFVEDAQKVCAFGARAGGVVR